MSVPPGTANGWWSLQQMQPKIWPLMGRWQAKLRLFAGPSDLSCKVKFIQQCSCVYFWLWHAVHVHVGEYNNPAPIRLVCHDPPLAICSSVLTRENDKRKKTITMLIHIHYTLYIVYGTCSKQQALQMQTVPRKTDVKLVVVRWYPTKKTQYELFHEGVKPALGKTIRGKKKR